MSPVPVSDEGVLLEEEGHLLVGVQANALGNQHGPVLVAAQLDVVGRPQQLLGHLQQHLVLGSSGPEARGSGKLRLRKFGEMGRRLNRSV